MTVAGFTDPDIQVFEVTHPDAPVFLSGVGGGQTTGDYRVSFQPRTPEAPYEVFAPPAQASPRI